jgi:hypothetical protein
MVLCRLLELVVGSFTMAWVFKRKGSLHGVTLPRSWILENVQKLYRVQDKGAQISMVREIIIPFQDLLERVYSGNDTGEQNVGHFLNYSTRSGHLFYQNKPLHSVVIRVRNVALARLYVLMAMSTPDQSPLTQYAIHRCRTICLRELLVLWCSSGVAHNACQWGSTPTIIQYSITS